MAMRVEWLGRLEFEACWSLQQETLSKISRNGNSAETVLLVEHPHVFTLGRKGDGSNILSRTGPNQEPVPVVRINRGGDVTYHGPGQLVGYPILNLSARRRDVHRYLRQLEEILIRVAGRFEISAFRRPGLTGVWTESGKLAAIGVGVKNWITQHGFALNVCADLRFFRLIHPCGIEGCQVVSLSSLLGRRVTLEEAVPVVVGEVVSEFGPNPVEPAQNRVDPIGVDS